MPVWPSELARSGDELLLRWVASGAVRSSRHREVPAVVWNRARAVLPQAGRLAGSFPTSGSGANCFGTVLAATGLDVSDVQIGPDTFENWLHEHTEPINGTDCDDDPGVVFAWTEHGDLAHATVTIGGGWMLTKPSQAWSSPRLIYTVREAVNSWRYPDTRMSRHRLLR
jgi:hypothetical protein